MIKNNSPSGGNEQINKYKCAVCNIDYKNALNYNRHIRDGETRSIFYRLEAILTKYWPSKGCREFFKTNSDLKKYMDYHFRITENGKLIFHIGHKGGELHPIKEYLGAMAYPEIIHALQTMQYITTPLTKHGNVKYATIKPGNTTGRIS